MGEASSAVVGRAGRFDAVICDIDGCLSDENGGVFDVEALGLVAGHNQRAQERGDRPLVTLCTGRPQPFAEAMSRLIGNVTLPLVAENGVWMYDPKTNGYEMDPKITREDRGAVRAASAWLEEAYGGRGVSQQPGKAASVSLYHQSPDFLKSICPEIEARFEREGWGLRVSMTWNYINCDLKHVSKGTGLERVMRATGLKRERMAGIGDTMGDMAIRERVAWFGCPANAAEELKRAADYVAVEREARGVVEILGRVGGGVGVSNRV